MALGSERGFGSAPEYLISWEAFKANDSHIVHHYGDRAPYVVLDAGGKDHDWHLAPGKLDVVSSTCPCAGLSQMSFGYGDTNKNNDWMPKAAHFVLEQVKPQVYWGENAPGLAGKIGKNVREGLIKIGRDAGYSMSFYRTKSLLHGVCQVRERAFYFFWKGDKVPMLNWFHREHDKVEDVISGVKSNFQTECINVKTPSRDDPYYRYILEEIHGGISHREFAQMIPASSARGNDVYSYIDKIAGRTYAQVGEWMATHGYEKEVAKCARRHAKLEEGKNVMRRGTVVPKDFIGAFVAHYPHMLTHPVEDRYINYREAMTIMGLPPDFELLDPKRSTNHICQNVPVQTAADMAGEVRAVLEGKREWVNSKLMFQYNHSKTFQTHDDGERATLEGIF